MVLGAAERLHALSCGGAVVVDVAGDRRRADERHRIDVGMREERVDRFLVAVNDVEHAVRQSGLFEQLRHATLDGDGSFSDGFSTKVVAAGQRDRKHPQRHHRRES